MMCICLWFPPREWYRVIVLFFYSSCINGAYVELRWMEVYIFEHVQCSVASSNLVYDLTRRSCWHIDAVKFTHCFRVTLEAVRKWTPDCIRRLIRCAVEKKINNTCVGNRSKIKTYHWIQLAESAMQRGKITHTHNFERPGFHKVLHAQVDTARELLINVY